MYVINLLLVCNMTTKKWQAK